jgi:hypothetical protein
MLSACSSNINVNTNYDYDSLAKQFSLDNINEVSYLKQNELVYNNLVRFYSENNYDKLDKVLPIINGESKISLRIMDWFTTNYAKKNYTIYTLIEDNRKRRFKVHNEYKLKLKSYSKKRFDPFCRWERIPFPYKDDTKIETTLGQLNFFKWVLENEVDKYIENHYQEIETDMNHRNSTAKNKLINDPKMIKGNKTRKKREELSMSAAKSIKREEVEVIIKFND